MGFIHLDYKKSKKIIKFAQNTLKEKIILFGQILRGKVVIYT